MAAIRMQITESKTGVKEFTWSPDGTKIAFVAQDSVPNPKAIKHNEDAFKVSYNNYLVRTEICSRGIFGSSHRKEEKPNN